MSTRREMKAAICQGKKEAEESFAHNAKLPTVEESASEPPPYGYSEIDRPKDGDWPEDFSHENGNYCNICFHCKRMFVGHKRRVECKTCAAKLPTPETQEAAPQAQPTVEQERPEGLPDYVMRYSPARDDEGFSTGGASAFRLCMWVSASSVFRMQREFRQEVAQLRAELHETRQLQIEEMDLCERAREAAEASNAQLRAEIANAAEFIKVVRETCFDDSEWAKYIDTEFPSSPFAAPKEPA